MNYTPGPWHAEGSVVTNEQDEIVIACVIGFCMRNDLGEDYATARLIAAAPDMLKALEAIVKSLAYHDDEGMIEHIQEMIDARAAIAKAKGEA